MIANCGACEYVSNVQLLMWPKNDLKTVYLAVMHNEGEMNNRWTWSICILVYLG